jgi:hypothetical protein
MTDRRSLARCRRDYPAYDRLERVVVGSEGIEIAYRVHYPELEALDAMSDRQRLIAACI